MPKLKAELAEGKEPQEGKSYKIVKVEETSSPVQKFPAIKVSMKSVDSKDEAEYASMCWKRDVVGQSSKLGSFMYAFLQFFDDEVKSIDTDNWIGHEIRFLSWKDKNREVRVIE